MVRQAHTYLVGAVSGATLIAIAIAAFVLLVSAQVFGDWPIAGLGGAKETAVHESQPVDGAGGDAEPAAAAGATTAAATADANAGAGRGDGVTSTGGDLRGGSTTGSQNAGEAVTGGGGGGQGGSGSSPSNPGSGDSGGGSTTSPSAGGSSGGSGGSSGGGSGGGGSSTASTPSQALTEGVNNTVTGVDQTVTDGALEKTGVTTVTEGVVNGVAGPESVVGKTVDGVADTVGGLLNPKP